MLEEIAKLSMASCWKYARPDEALYIHRKKHGAAKRSLLSSQDEIPVCCASKGLPSLNGTDEVEEGFWFRWLFS